MKGSFYGVSVGPGDPELITVKALRRLEQTEVLAVPRTRGEHTMALDILRGILDLRGKELLYLDFLMSRDRSATERSHREMAERVCAYLEEGRDVAMLNIGDASIFGTWGYLRSLVEAAGYRTETIPGVPSFCAAAAVLNRSLTEKGSPLTVIPGAYKGVGEALRSPGTKVLMKAGNALPEAIRLLEEAGLASRTGGVADCGLPTQRVFRDLRALDGAGEYFVTLLTGPSMD